MERSGDRKGQRATNSFLPGDIDRPVDRRFRAGDDDLSGRVDVGHREDVATCGLLTDFLRLFDAGSNERGHAARADRHGLLHEFPTRANDLRSLWRLQAADADDRAVLAERMAGDQIASRSAQLLEDLMNRR